MRGNEPAAETQNNASVWDTFLIGLRYREGRIIQLSGNNTIFLNDSRYAWFVYNGKVDVFTAYAKNGMPGALKSLSYAVKHPKI